MLMKLLLRKLILGLLTVSILLSLHIPVFARNASQATEISSTSLIVDRSGFPSPKYLFNNKFWETQVTEDRAHLTLEYKDGIGSLYLSFMNAYGEYTIINNDSGDTYTAGKDLFIHEFIDLTACFGAAPSSVTISFENGPAQLHELDVFTEGTVPDSVQKWTHPEEGKVDLILFSSHSDDDQLFFAGLLPYYAVERDYQVLVIYLTDHYNTAPGRRHEVLTGLWAVGVKTYPIFGHYEDFGDATTAEEAFRKFARYGHSQEEMTNFVVEQLRRFKPMVAVGHDLKGEYGHAQHRAYAKMLTDAVEISGDAACHPESADQYGIWDVPKTYIHLYKENPIVMDWDQPMKSFNGMTPYQVSKKLGFPAHVSQQKGWGWYYDGKDTAKQIKEYSPCEYGLYRTTVGPDTGKQDMFENLTSHAEQLQAIPDAITPEIHPTDAPQTAETHPHQEETQVQEAPTADPMPPITSEQESPTESPAADTAPETTPDGQFYRLMILEIVLVVLLLVLLILKARKKKNRQS